MGAQTANATIRSSQGDATLMIYQFTSVTAGDTFASGLGTNIIDYWATVEATPNTSTQQGASVANSSGTFTLNPAFPAAMSLFVLTRT